MELYFKPEWRAPAAVGAASFVAGALAGYLVSRRKMNRTIDTVIDEIAADERESQLKLDFIKAAEENAPRWDGFTTENVPVGDNRLPIFKDNRLVGRVNNLEIDEEGLVAEAEITDKKVLDEISPPLGPVSITNDPPNTWVQIEEEADRVPDSPYIISREEYLNSETDFVQSELTWYAADKIMCDENMTIVYDVNKVTGNLRFGHGSDDPDIVYIRNEKLRGEYEVTRNSGSYAAEVYGIEAEEEADQADDELKHSIPRFRQY